MKSRKMIIILALVVVLASSMFLSACTRKVTNFTSSYERGYVNHTSLVVASELKEMSDVVIVDFTSSGSRYIPGAVKIKREDVVEVVNGVSGMIASKEKIEAVFSEAGIKNSDTIVIYDSDRSLWATRLWWVFKVYGHEKVKLLDGGLDSWISAGFETRLTTKTLEKSNYIAKAPNENLIADLELIKKSFDNDKLVVLDTRSDGEWKDGRIPGAIHIEWTKALNEDGTFKTAAELKEIYESAGITKDKEGILPHCRAAVRSAHTMFALQELLGYKNVRNYDGSWIEYEKSGLQIEK